VLLVVSSVLAFLGKPTEMGLAILAGAIGLAFANIDKIRKFKGAGFEAEMREKVEAVVAKETEPEPEAITIQKTNLIDGGKRDILTALGNTKYTWRYLGGIAEETKLSKEIVTSALSELVHRGLVIRTTEKTEPMWALTSFGRQVLLTSSSGGTNA
jgi:hypothetical protein